MNQTDLTEQLKTIRSMIEKTRKETAESGNLLIAIGLFSALSVLVMGLLEMSGHTEWNWPILIVTVLFNGTAGFLIARKADKNRQVVTYARTVFWNLWMMSGFAALILVFVFPLLHVYPISAVPVLIAILMGVGVYVSGIIFESKPVSFTALSWWLAAILLVLTQNPYRFLIMTAAILIGWVLPGIFLRRETQQKATL